MDDIKFHLGTPLAISIVKTFTVSPGSTEFSSALALDGWDVDATYLDAQGVG